MGFFLRQIKTWTAYTAGCACQIGDQLNHVTIRLKCKQSTVTVCYTCNLRYQTGLFNVMLDLWHLTEYTGMHWRLFLEVAWLRKAGKRLLHLSYCRTPVWRR